MPKISSLPNIGKTLEKLLNEAGVNTCQELVSEGTENVFLKLKGHIHDGTCINKLYAIEGAIQGIRWHNLPKERKEQLKKFYDDTK